MMGLIDKQRLLADARKLYSAITGRAKPFPVADAFMEIIEKQPIVQSETNCSEFPNNSDTISRQAAIDALDKRFDSIPMEQTSEILLLRKDLREMPPIQPAEPKRGKWVGKYPVTSVCSECGYLINDSKVKVFAFCPNCGADMRGEQDG